MLLYFSKAAVSSSVKCELGPEDIPLGKSQGGAAFASATLAPLPPSVPLQTEAPGLLIPQVRARDIRVCLLACGAQL
jgi:hypothetical protein